MKHPLRFYVAVLPNLPWPELLARYQQVESLGFDMVSFADHFIDWSNPPSPWFELWTQVAAVAQATSRIRLLTGVAQIPLRDPATLANHALTVDHISGGRLELGLGIGLTIDPSYEMMGLENWSNKERVARVREYLEVVDLLLSQQVSSYEGHYYQLHDAVMSPSPVQRPRPPITLAAMGPKMLKHAARYADVWNSMSFADNFETQLAQTRERISKIDGHCEAFDRDPASLIRSYHMFDPSSRAGGGAIIYYQSTAAFADMVSRVTALGISDIGLYYPMQAAQLEVFERIASEVIPALKAEHTGTP
ncbi:MAG: alkanesulfonate monooxygenase SsuD [Gammaproteobacteria bacterium]|jgi:alkanesulfonate monooxygenase SsuD/methylene tetrahydromethanopterin reductase-like flavin-dependent oxidoreductase (luciferase family)